MVDSMDYLPSFGNSGNSLLKFTFNCYLPTNVEDKETFMFHKRNFKLMSEDNANTDWGSQIKGNNIHNRSVSTDIQNQSTESAESRKLLEKHNLLHGVRMLDCFDPYLLVETDRCTHV